NPTHGENPPVSVAKRRENPTARHAPAVARARVLSKWLQLAPGQCGDGLGGPLDRRAPRPSRRLDPLAVVAVGRKGGRQLLGDALALHAKGRLVVEREGAVVE